MNNRSTNNKSAADITLKPLEILIVDDDWSDRYLITHGYLPQTGLPIGKISEACDGSDALQFLESHLPDAVLSDLNMPKIDGFEFLQKIKQDSRLSRLPVIILAGVMNEGKIQELLKAGAKAVFIKQPNISGIKATALALAETIRECVRPTRKKRSSKPNLAA